MKEKIKSLQVDGIEKIKINRMKEDLESMDKENDSLRKEIEGLKSRIVDLEQNFNGSIESESEQVMDTDEPFEEQVISMVEPEKLVLFSCD